VPICEGADRGLSKFDEVVSVRVGNMKKKRKKVDGADLREFRRREKKVRGF
jgi:hypothetical protein